MQGRSPTFASPSSGTGGAAAWLRRRQRRHGADCRWHLDRDAATRRPRPPRLPSRSPRTAVDSPPSHGRSTAGMQVAVSTSGGAFTPEAGATDASASQPAVGISSAGAGVRRVGLGRIGAGEDSQCRGNVGIRDLARLGRRAERECRLVGRRRRQLARLDPRVRRIAPVGDGRPAELARRPPERTAGP